MRRYQILFSVPSLLITLYYINETALASKQPPKVDHVCPAGNIFSHNKLSGS